MKVFLTNSGMSWFPAPEHPSSTLKPTLRTASSSMSRVSRESKKPTPLVPTNSRPARSGVASDPTLWPRTPTRRRLPRGRSLEPNSLCKKQDQKYYVWVSFSYSVSNSKFCFEVRQLAHCNVYEPSEIVVRNRTRFLKISTLFVHFCFDITSLAFLSRLFWPSLHWFPKYSYKS